MENLEQKTEKSGNLLHKVRSLYSPNLKSYLVNTFTPMPFFQSAFVLNEYFIAGAEPLEILKTRGINIFVSILANDILFRKRDKVKGKISDIAASFAVAPFIYIGFMKAGGMDWGEIIRALPVGVLLMGLATTAYLKIHDRIRKALGTYPVELMSSEERLNYEMKRESYLDAINYKIK